MEILNIGIFVVLVLELLLCTLAALPIAMHTRKKIFGTIHKALSSESAKIGIKVIFFIMAAIFTDALYNAYQTDKKIHSEEIVATEKTNLYLRLFRYQRNSYMTGFCLFLFFLIYRSQSIIAELSSLETKSEAVIKQSKQNQNQTEALLAENTELKKEVKSLKKMEIEFKAMKSQAENTSAEYMKLKEEYSNLLGKKSKVDKKNE
eukprot:gene8565-10535_t